MKKNNKTIILVIIIFTALFACAIFLYNDFCPKAPSIQCPEKGELLSVALESNELNLTISLYEEHYEKLIEYIKTATSTRMQSINDCPAVRPYYCIKMQTEQMHYQYFVYEDHGKIYIEMPYQGIYETEDDLLRLVLKYFEENKIDNIIQKQIRKIFETSLKIYREMSDCTWECEGYTYKYKLEISGRMHNATTDSTFIYLSNMENITFDQAWKAAGLSSNLDDYFAVEDAVLVDMRTD